ncbi:hypothetical protein OOT33_00370 [Sphingobium sp. DEHP117]|uniref:hypothetical protein n=1 Tax=Sphingobium sp. DEHP117 TaxID=2993436 RepID=UPI0027D63B2E|nr:hypothetical protein [Sphingobium sp. DEHP117]MDQ4418901.1 hypothetical protein [Sphingobium sp. DEHP117]
MKRRDAHIILVALAGLGGAGAGALIPVDMLELASRASGLAQALPAAAPPLGDTARGLFIGIAGLGTAGLAALISPWRGRIPHKNTRDRDMTFMETALGGLFRRRAKRVEHVEAAPAEQQEIELPPSVRRADAHPDAPPRAPLMVSRDLAGGLSSLIEEEPRGPIVEDITGLALPRAPEPLPWEAIETEMSRLLDHVRFRAVETAPYMPQPVNAAPAPTEPTIRDLTERLERGIARRRSDPVVAQAFQPADAIDPDAMQEAEGEPASRSPDLDAALAALRGLSARVG